MSRFFYLLNFFKRNEKITRFFLLNKSPVTKELIDEALQKGYIVETTPCEDGGIRYSITEKGIRKRGE